MHRDMYIGINNSTELAGARSIFPLLYGKTEKQKKCKAMTCIDNIFQYILVKKNMRDAFIFVEYWSTKATYDAKKREKFIEKEFAK